MAETSKTSDQIHAKLPIFDGDNYERWTAQMKVVFRYHGVLDVIHSGVTPLNEAPTETERATHREQMKKDDKAIYFLHQCVDSNVLENIIEYETAKEAWDVLATTYAGDKQTKKVKLLMALRRQLGQLQMEPNETVTQFVNRLTVLTNQMKSCGEAVTDSLKVEKVITGLTPKFDSLVAAIEQSKDLDTLKLEQLIGSLEAHELKLKNRDGVKKDEKETENALFTQSQKKGSGSYESWKKKGKGKWKSNKNEGGNGKGKKKSKEHIQCYNCQKWGHFADECVNPKVPRKRNEEAQLARDSDEEVVALVATIDEEVMMLMTVTEGGGIEWWYLDTGCSNHMTSHLEWFCEIDKTVRRKIRFGDGSYVIAEGIGNVAIRREDGTKVIVSDVLYVPQMKSNLLSLGQLLEKGYSMNMNGNYMEVFDSKKKVVLKVSMSRNRTFKVGVNSIDQKCLIAQEDDIMWKWHKRMGHLNFNSLKMLQKKNMVVGLPQIEEPKEICGKCCEGKATKEVI
jgi:hypothetical protein